MGALTKVKVCRPVVMESPSLTRWTSLGSVQWNWMAEHHIAQSSGMVGLHVVDKDIVQLTTAQSILQIFKELGLDGPVHRVKQHGLLIQQQVGVEGHPTGNRMGALEQGVLAVVSADPNQIFGDMTDTVHIENPSFW